MKKIGLGILGFIFLNLYFNITTHFVGNTMLQLLGLLLFFPLAGFIAKRNGLDGLKGLGMKRDKQSLRYFGISFLIGFSCWALLYATYGLLGKFQLMGIKTASETAWIFAQIIVGFFLGSLINDLITRGYVVGFLKNKLPPFTVGAISVAIYALDDFWNGELTLVNFLFSILLGCSLTYAFYRTGSIWASTGIHFGLNMAFGLLYGLSGDVGDGVFVAERGSIEPFVNNSIILSITVLLFLPVFLYYRKKQSLTLKENMREMTDLT
ncbi:CPBP family intramembrane glutamic endopeptidase [Chungangia koreensis]|uniref:CPBP family intramembrane glutamic endopeptidase n=1 Tax=Chungangia koreensis TaxID=752657 RepID=A0ABV8X0W7_9LACT